jgi:hypothetical protein
VNCDQAINLISARIDNEITPSDRAALDSHLSICPACRVTADALAQQDELLDRAFAPRRAAATAVADRVIAQLQTVAPLKTSAPRTTQKSFWSNWARPLLAAAAGFALAILITRPWNKPVTTPLAVGTTTAVKPQPIAQLSLATGAVYVCPRDSTQWHALETGGPVEAGAKIRTGPKVRCEFKLADGSEVRLNSQTEVCLPAPRRVEVAGGQIYSSVHKLPGGDAFIVNATPAETTFTALGTEFDVSCAPQKATLTVVDGAVKTRSGAKEDVIKGGETLTIAAGQFGDKKQVDKMLLATQWVDEILVLKGRDNPELARRIDDIFAQLGRDKMWYMQAQEVRRLGDHCVIPLARYIQSDRSKQNEDERMKRREAARIVSDVATTWAVPELINLLADEDGDVRYAAANALQRLTGQSQGRRPQDWRDQPLFACTPSIEQWHTWWDQNKSRFPGADPDAVQPIQVVKQKAVNPKEEQKGKG